MSNRCPDRHGRAARWTASPPGAASSSRNHSPVGAAVCGSMRDHDQVPQSRIHKSFAATPTCCCSCGCCSSVVRPPKISIPDPQATADAHTRTRTSASAYASERARHGTARHGTARQDTPTAQNGYDAGNGAVICTVGHKEITRASKEGSSHCPHLRRAQYGVPVQAARDRSTSAGKPMLPAAVDQQRPCRLP